MESAPPAWLQFAPLIVLLGLVVYPLSRVLRRIGYSGWYALLIFVLPVAIFGLWLLAYMRWPAVDDRLRRVFDDGPDDQDNPPAEPAFLRQGRRRAG